MKLYCNAKINLTLAVKGKRADGYHLLDSVMQSVDIKDTLYINKAEKIKVCCSNPLFDGKENIAFKAAECFFKAANIKGGAEIIIEKGIPDAAGLGGGSADAAGVIVALNRLYETNFSNKKLCEIALLVGADVPFCIEGGTKRAGGIGEILEDCPPFCDCFIVVSKNGNKLSTKDMYNKLDALKKLPYDDTQKFINALESGDFKACVKYIGNSFSCVTGLYGIDTLLKPTNPLAVSLSGSGPSVFAVYENKADADTALNLLIKNNITAFKCRPTKNSIVFE